VNVCVTGVAGANVAFPFWLAVTEQIPAVSRVTVAPFVPPVVHTAVEFVEKLTGRPDVEDADIVTGEAVIATFGG